MRYRNSIFQSFFQAGFECSTHKIDAGRRLDLIASTRHDELALRDYEALQRVGITTVREGARWYLIEKVPGEYDFRSLDVLLDAADHARVEVILDLLHFGWPDHVDIFSDGFVNAFEAFTRAVIRHLLGRGRAKWMLAPTNEISFLSWAAGDEGFIFPFAVGRGSELKRRLARTAIRASEVIRAEAPEALVIWPEPVIHIVGDDQEEGSAREAELYRLAQYEAWDMISGRLHSELGGKPSYLDVIGVNFYDRNEWVHNSRVSLKRTDRRYRPFREILQEVWGRYRRPLFVAETGTEDEKRVDWFDYVCQEVSAAINAGVPVHGICLYPIVNHPGWEDDRYCCNGLFDYADEGGARVIYKPLAEAILEKQESLAPGALRGYSQ